MVARLKHQPVYRPETFAKIKIVEPPQDMSPTVKQIDQISDSIMLALNTFQSTKGRKWFHSHEINEEFDQIKARIEKGMQKLQEDIAQTDLVKLEEKVKMLSSQVNTFVLENGRLEEALRHSHQRIQELDMIGRNIRNNHAKTVQELVERIDDLERENKRLMTDNIVLQREATAEPW